jgi:mRNA-degrading endonuclease toxin of MazEF toxin-antitoxin module
MKGLETGVFDAQGIGSIPVARLERRVGAIESGVLHKIEAAVKLWLSLP